MKRQRSSTDVVVCFKPSAPSFSMKNLLDNAIESVFSGDQESQAVEYLVDVFGNATDADVQLVPILKRRDSMLVDLLAVSLKHGSVWTLRVCNLIFMMCFRSYARASAYSEELQRLRDKAFASEELFNVFSKLLSRSRDEPITAKFFSMFCVLPVHCPPAPEEVLLRLFPLLIDAVDHSTDDCFIGKACFMLSAMLPKPDAENSETFKTSLLDANRAFAADVCRILGDGKTQILLLLKRLCVNFARARLEAIEHGVLFHLLRCPPGQWTSETLNLFGYYHPEALKTALNADTVKHLFAVMQQDMQNGESIHQILSVLQLACFREDLISLLSEHYELLLSVLHLSGSDKSVLLSKASACAMIRACSHFSLDTFVKLSAAVFPLVDLCVSSFSVPHVFDCAIKALFSTLYVQRETSFSSILLWETSAVNVQLVLSSPFPAFIRSVTKSAETSPMASSKFGLIVAIMVLLAKDGRELALTGNDEDFISALMRHSVLSDDESLCASASLLLQLLLGEERFAGRRAEVVSSLLKLPAPMAAFPSGESCTICRSEEACEGVVYTPCFHAYHVSCLSQWLNVRDVCPMCNKSVLCELRSHLLNK